MILSPGHEALEALFTEKQVSSWLGISPPSLQRMRSNGCGPAFVQLSARRIGYRKSAVEAWLSARTVSRVGELNDPPQKLNTRPAPNLAVQDGDAK